MTTDNQRLIKNLKDAGKTRQPIHEKMLCGCGHDGPPEVILEMEVDHFVCPKCGDY